MTKLMQELASIEPMDESDFAYEIFSVLLSDSNNQFYCSSLIEGLKVVAEKEQEILSSGEYNHDDDDENLPGYYSINNQEFYFDDLADKLKDVKTDKKILPDTWGPGYHVIG